MRAICVSLLTSICAVMRTRPRLSDRRSRSAWDVRSITPAWFYPNSTYTHSFKLYHLFVLFTSVFDKMNIFPPNLLCYRFITALHYYIPYKKRGSAVGKTTELPFLFYHYIVLYDILISFHYSSQYSNLLTDTSYATRFSNSVSDNFFWYSRLWILPQSCTCPPTEKLSAKRAFLPQQIHGI